MDAFADARYYDAAAYCRLPMIAAAMPSYFAFAMPLTRRHSFADAAMLR